MRTRTEILKLEPCLSFSVGCLAQPRYYTATWLHVREAGSEGRNRFYSVVAAWDGSNAELAESSLHSELANNLLVRCFLLLFFLLFFARLYRICMFWLLRYCETSGSSDTSERERVFVIKT